jgi:zinc/manganese transport system substrate-binding protein
MTRLLAAFSLALALLASPLSAAEKLKIVASFSVLGDMVRQIAGSHADVTTLVGPNGDAHTFEPSPSDAKTIADADLVFINGLGLERWMEGLARSAGYKGPLAIASEGVKTRTMVEEEEGNNQTVTDPHAWQDLENGVIYVNNIVAALTKADPADEADYKFAGDAFAATLKALDANVRKQISTVPPAKRRVITSHDAFGYFGAAYGVKFLAPEGLSTESEASAGDIAKLIAQIKREGIKALFVENVADPRMIEMIGKETGVKLGGALYSDALSPPDGPAPHYVDMFKNNVPKLIAGMMDNE